MWFLTILREISTFVSLKKVIGFWTFYLPTGLLLPFLNFDFGKKILKVRNKIKINGFTKDIAYHAVIVW